MSLQPWNLVQPDSSTSVVHWNIRSNGPKRSHFSSATLWYGKILVGWVKAQLTQLGNVSDPAAGHCRGLYVEGVNENE